MWLAQLDGTLRRVDLVSGRTTALVHTIAGLNDFELIAFVVIEGAEA